MMMVRLGDSWLKHVFGYTHDDGTATSLYVTDNRTVYGGHGLPQVMEPFGGATFSLPLFPLHVKKFGVLPEGVDESNIDAVWNAAADMLGQPELKTVSS